MSYQNCSAYTHNTNTCYLHPVNTVLNPMTPGNCIASGIVRPKSVIPPPPPPPPLPPIKPAPPGAKNVMFFISDDLRPEMMEAYGQEYMITPNFDKLAKSSTVFNRAFCQQAICGPTRNSFLSGRRPQRTQAWNFIDHFREPVGGLNGNEPARVEDGRKWISFPGYFKFNGYTTLGGGKTYHPGLPPNDDGNFSWSPDKAYVNNGDCKCTSDYFSGGQSLVCPDNKKNLSVFTDYANLEGMLDDLQYASDLKKSTGKPFFLNYGVHRPHLPFHFPAEFGGENIWEKYGDNSKIPLPKHPSTPKDMPGIAFTYELDGKLDICVFGDCSPIPGPTSHVGNGSCPFCGPALPDNSTQIMRKGYYSAVSYLDFLVGEMMAKLEELGHADDTVIAVVGDHGWQLGEHNIWGKHTNFELGTRVPLIIKAPGQSEGIKSNALVESVDIYPTVAKLAGLPNPPDVDGIDLSPLWKEPDTPLKNVSFSEYPRCAPPDAAWEDTTSCVHTQRSNFTIMGYSVRTDQWRATFWMWWNGAKLAAYFDKPPAAVELYAHSGDEEADFDKFENENVAKQNPDVVAVHFAMAKAQWEKP